MNLNLTGAVTAAVLLTVTACSGSGADDSSRGDASPPAAATASPLPPGFVQAAQAAANDSLLTLADFPAGWTQTPRDPNPPKLGLTGDCAVLESDGLPGDVAHAVSDDFIGASGQDVTTGSSIWPDELSVQQALDSYAAAVSSCSDEYTVAYERWLRGELKAKGIVSDEVRDLIVSIVPAAAPEVGDASIAFRLSTRAWVRNQPFELNLDMFVLRNGNALGYLSYFLQGDPDPQEEGTLVGKLDASLKEVSHSSGTS